MKKDDLNRRAFLGKLGVAGAAGGAALTGILRHSAKAQSPSQGSPMPTPGPSNSNPNMPWPSGGGRFA